MATKVAHIRSTSPVVFVSEHPATAGTQYHIPLSVLRYDAAKGVIDVSEWAPIKTKKLGAADRKLLPILLADLLRRGVLSVAPAP